MHDDDVGDGRPLELNELIAISNKKSLYDIWNGDLYDKFRKDHFDGNPCIKCNTECDMPKIGEYF